MFPHQGFCQILLLATLWQVHHFNSYEHAFSRDVECFMFFHFLCQWRKGVGNSSNDQLLLPPLPVPKGGKNSSMFSLCVPRRDGQSLVLCLLLWPTLPVEGVGVSSSVYSSHDLCFCEGMGSSFPASCLCWRDENVFFSFLLCFGEGIRYLFRLFLQSFVEEVGISSNLLVQPPVSLLNGWCLLLSYPSSTSSVFIEWMAMA